MFSKITHLKYLPKTLDQSVILQLHHQKLLDISAGPFLINPSIDGGVHYLFSSQNLYGRGEDSIEEYDPDGGRWRKVPIPLKQSRFGGQSVQISAVNYPACIG